MKKDLHPKIYLLKVVCTTCGTKFNVNSTVQDIKADVCSSCHPFYAGKATAASSAGRIERFNKRFNKKNND